MAGSFPRRFDGKKGQPRRRSPPSMANSMSRRSTIVLLFSDRLAHGLRLAVQPFDYVVDCVLIEAFVEAARNVSNVRRRQQVRLTAERMIEGQGLLIEYIHGRAGNFAGAQRF